MACAAAGLLIATGIKMLLPHSTRPAAIFFAMVAFALMVVAKLPLLIVLLGVAPITIAIAKTCGAIVISWYFLLIFLECLYQLLVYLA